ncbi:bifunctional cytidylyltransferase/SDR family oxidoreductase [Sphaerisporangium sp. NPDC051017]|uniref:bifunctional cytidylyltransferase/SDR family oxidoreductase n=1 Tax=Sphaerisporangium sp. NPDC051017 TaxID=3154636 RepID=UPI003420BFCB
MTGGDVRRRVVGVVLAGGVGRRMGHGRPKQLLKLGGRTIIEHTLAVFERAPEIDEVVVLMAPGFTAEAERIVARGGFRKVRQVVEGGATRTESTWRALQALGTDECDVLLHDAVRPLVEPRIISDCVKALRTHSAVNVAIPSSDTILVAAPGPSGEVIREIPDRSLLRRVQTPQGFRLSVIREAYERAWRDPDFAGRPATDDCGVVLRYLPDVPIHIVPGSERNMKVTHPVDVHIAEKLIELASRAAPAPAGPDACRRALEGRTVVVFGGDDTGIGPRIAGLATGYGATVHVFSRTTGPGGSGVRVEDPASVAHALEQAAKRSGRVDHVVHVAGPVVGAADGGGLDEVGEEAVREAITVDHLGPVTIARASLPYLRETRGHLLLSTLGASAGAWVNASLRSSTAAAVAALTRALAEEWADLGIKVNCVTLTDTGTPPVEPRHGDSLPSPDDIARMAVTILASDLTGHLTTATHAP